MRNFKDRDKRRLCKQIAGEWDTKQKITDTHFNIQFKDENIT